ncbi:hypothetical protein H340_31313, partial [Streptomyces mobaraensis NBRC 13819 = DSM 40847]
MSGCGGARGRKPRPARLVPHAGRLNRAPTPAARPSVGEDERPGRATGARAEPRTAAAGRAQRRAAAA